MLAGTADSHHSTDACWRASEKAAPKDGEDTLLTTSYVLVETFALVQARLGLQATRLLNDDVVPILRITWVDEELHRAAITALVTAQRRDLSLVDCVSFEAIRRLGAERAFAFDRHFRQQGFAVIP